jgi:uncharacterized membrane protein
MMHAATIIIKSQHRLATENRLTADQYYLVDTEAWEEVKALSIISDNRTRR